MCRVWGIKKVDYLLKWCFSLSTDLVKRLICYLASIWKKERKNNGGRQRLSLKHLMCGYWSLCLSDAAGFTLNPNGSWETEPRWPDWVNSPHPSRASEPWNTSFGRVRREAAGSGLTSPVPLALLLLLDLPLEVLVGLGLLVLLQLSHVALLVPLRLVQVALRREERRGGEVRREERRGVSQRRNKQAGRYDGWLVGKRIASTWSSFLVEDELKRH